LFELGLDSPDQLLDGNDGTVYVSFELDLLLVYVGESLFTSELLKRELDVLQLASDLLYKAVVSSSREGLEFVDDASKYFSELTGFDGDGLSYESVAGKNVLEETGKFNSGSFHLDGQLVDGLSLLADVSDGVDADVEVLYGSIVFDEDALDDGVGVSLVLLSKRLSNSQFLDLSVGVLYFGNELSSEISSGSGGPGSSDLLEGGSYLSQVLGNLLEGGDIEFAAVANFRFEFFNNVVDMAGISEGLDGESLFNSLAADTDKRESLSQVVGDGFDLGSKLLGTLAIISHVTGVLHLDEDVTKGSQNIVEYTIDGTSVVSVSLGYLELVLSGVGQSVEFGDYLLDLCVELSAQFLYRHVRFKSVSLLKRQSVFV